MGNLKWVEGVGRSGGMTSPTSLLALTAVFIVGHLQRGGYLDPESYEAWVTMKPVTTQGLQRKLLR